MGLGSITTVTVEILIAGAGQKSSDTFNTKLYTFDICELLRNKFSVIFTQNYNSDKC